MAHYDTAGNSFDEQPYNHIFRNPLSFEIMLKFHLVCLREKAKAESFLKADSNWVPAMKNKLLPPDWYKAIISKGHIQPQL